MRARIARTVPTVPPRQREGMSTAHLAMVRKLWCVLCGVAAQEAHHLLRAVPNGERGMGRRAADRYAIPLCTRCHREVHSDGDDEAFLSACGIDGRRIADGLWQHRGDEVRMRRVIERSLLARGIHA